MLSVFYTANKPLLLMISIKKFFRTYNPAILWWIIVLVLICTPGKDLPKLGSWTDLVSLDKIIHFFIFGLMGYLFMRPFALNDLSNDHKKRHFLKLAIALSIWGLTTEFIQHFFISGRSLDILDFVADTAGCFAAYVYCKNYFLK
jgi:VanZ family protein